MLLSPNTVTILKALMPYTRENLMLAYKPGQLFNELEKSAKSSTKHHAYKGAYYRAIKKGLIEVEHGVPLLTQKGLESIKLYEPKELNNSAFLLLSFDIPEHEREKRNRLRRFIKHVGFIRIQQSLWSTDKDCRELLSEEIKDLEIEKYVNLYESVRINL